MGGMRGGSMDIRTYNDSDLEEVVRLFTASVHDLTAEHYDAAQRAAWAPQPPQEGEWRERLGALQTLIAEKNGKPMGFIAYDAAGYIDLLYTSPQHTRRGVASSLYRRTERALISAGVHEVSTKASSVARPFFERHGFDVIEQERVFVRGAWFQRYAMRKVVTSAQQGAPADAKTAGRFSHG